MTATKIGAKRAAAKKSPPKKPRLEKRSLKKAAPRVVPRRADFGAPVDAFFAKQPAEQRAILTQLRRIIDDVAPDATATIKWGMPFYTVGDAMMCALASFKAHVNLILHGPPGTYADPHGLLEGDGKSGRHLKLHARADVPAGQVRAWVQRAAELARGNAR